MENDVEKEPDIVLPDLPEGYTWDTSDGDYNIIEGNAMFINGVNLIGYIRCLHDTNVIRCYVSEHKEQHFDNLQDAIDVMATRFTLGLYFQDEN